METQDSRPKTQGCACHGITLVELLVASVLGVVVALAMGQVDVSRIYHSQQVRGTATAQAEAGFAVTHMTKQLAQADRIQLVSASNIQIRRPEFDTDSGSCVGCTGTAPPPCCFDIAGNYTWSQYVYDSASRELRFYDDTAGGCPPAAAVTFRDLSAVTIRKAPNEATSDPNDTVENMLILEIASTNPFTDITMTYNGQATLRAGANDMTTGLGAPGPPPGSCS